MNYLFLHTQQNTFQLFIQGQQTLHLTIRNKSIFKRELLSNQTRICQRYIEKVHLQNTKNHTNKQYVFRGAERMVLID